MVLHISFKTNYLEDLEVLKAKYNLKTNADTIRFLITLAASNHKDTILKHNKKDLSSPKNRRLSLIRLLLTLEVDEANKIAKQKEILKEDFYIREPILFGSMQDKGMMIKSFFVDSNEGRVVRSLYWDMNTDAPSTNDRPNFSDVPAEKYIKERMKEIGL